MLGAFSAKGGVAPRWCREEGEPQSPGWVCFSFSRMVQTQHWLHRPPLPCLGPTPAGSGLLGRPRRGRWLCAQFLLKGQHNRGLCVEVPERADFPLAATAFPSCFCSLFLFKETPRLWGQVRLASERSASAQGPSQLALDAQPRLGPESGPHFPARNAEEPASQVYLGRAQPQYSPFMHSLMPWTSEPIL